VSPSELSRSRSRAQSQPYAAAPAVSGCGRGSSRNGMRVKTVVTAHPRPGGVASCREL
jgi:hypothetical protein